MDHEQEHRMKTKTGALIASAACVSSAVLSTWCEIGKSRYHLSAVLERFATSLGQHQNNLNILKLKTPRIEEPEKALSIALPVFGLGSTTLYVLHDGDKYQDSFILAGLVIGLCTGASSRLTIEATLLSVLPWTVLTALLVSAVWHRRLRRGHG